MPQEADAADQLTRSLSDGGRECEKESHANPEAAALQEGR